MLSIPWLLALKDEDVATICRWGEQEKLSNWALQVFMFDRNLPLNDPFNEIVTIYRQQKSLLLKPLQEVDNLLDTPEQWGQFALNLILTGINAPRLAAKKARENLRQADEIKKQIRKKTIELVKLASDLEKIGDYSGANTMSRYIYPELLSKAAEIHNDQYHGIENHNLPGVFVGSAKESYQLTLDAEKDPAGFRNWIDSCRDRGDDCSYQNDAEKILRNLLYKSFGEVPLPSIEALILSYGKFIQEEAVGHSDPLRYSKRCSPGDFIRGFTANLLCLVGRGHLPEKIKTLSNGSIETFAEVFYPHMEIKASNYVTATWAPKKDAAKDKEISDQNHAKSQ